MTDHPQIKAFLIFKDPAVCRPVADGLTKVGYEVFQYQAARSFLLDRHNHRHGVVVSEIRLVGASGLELAEQLSNEKEKFPVILISTATDIPKAVQVGVDFLCGKPTVEVLIKAIGRALSPVKFEERLLRRSFQRLTMREIEILEKVAAGNASGDIGILLGISTKTVEAHRARINAKTRARDVAELVQMWRAYLTLQ